MQILLFLASVGIERKCHHDLVYIDNLYLYGTLITGTGNTLNNKIKWINKQNNNKKINITWQGKHNLEIQNISNFTRNERVLGKLDRYVW